jgi:hypothetical protein
MKYFERKTNDQSCYNTIQVGMTIGIYDPKHNEFLPFDPTMNFTLLGHIGCGLIFLPMNRLMNKNPYPLDL